MVGDMLYVEHSLTLVRFLFHPTTNHFHQHLNNFNHLNGVLCKDSDGPEGGGSDLETRTLSISARVIVGDTVHIQIVSSSRSVSIKTAIVFTDLGKEGF